MCVLVTWRERYTNTRTHTEREEEMADQNASGFNTALRKVKPYLAIISLQFGYSGMYIITMVSFKHGMNHWVLSVYRHVVALLIMAPFALVLERFLTVSVYLNLF